MMSAAYRIELNVEKSRKKINMIVSGTMIARRFMARCMFSKAPPHGHNSPAAGSRAQSPVAPALP